MTLLFTDFDFSPIYKADSDGSWTFSFELQLFFYFYILVKPPLAIFKTNLTFLPKATTELSSVEYDNPLKWSVPKSLFQNPCLLF